jgi:glyoxylase-like metal-dependent hydrolase (beta-lactamase superfamily II)
MKLFKIETGSFKLDGGAMFGVVPKVLWSKVYQADENNLCTLSLRCLLVKTNKKLILIDTGLGNKQSEKFFGFYYLNDQVALDKAIQKSGFTLEDITDVILTHLHFDHCGGALVKTVDNTYKLQFPNACYWVSQTQWKWAMNPNQREKASYLKENIDFLSESGKLRFIEKEGLFTENIYIRMFNGHSQGVMIPVLTVGSKTLVYVGDVIPTAAHVPISWVCGFDTQPLVSMKEKADFLKEAQDNNYVFFFEHDYYNECCSLTANDNKVCVKEVFKFEEFFSGTL